MAVSAKGRYMYEEERLATFKKWPFKKSLCNVHKLAEAGFIFCDSKVDHDLVQCQVCLKKLYSWEEDDDPCLAAHHQEDHPDPASGMSIQRMTYTKCCLYRVDPPDDEQ